MGLETRRQEWEEAKSKPSVFGEGGRTPDLPCHTSRELHCSQLMTELSSLGKSVRWQDPCKYCNRRVKEILQPQKRG